jgi:hypothetical protein
MATRERAWAFALACSNTWSVVNSSIFNLLIWAVFSTKPNLLVHAGAWANTLVRT